MANDINLVTLSVSSYNQIKAENYRLNMLLDNLLLEAKADQKQEKLVFDPAKVELAVKFCFQDRWRKKLGLAKEVKNDG